MISRREGFKEVPKKGCFFLVVMSSAITITSPHAEWNVVVLMLEPGPVLKIIERA